MRTYNEIVADIVDEAETLVQQVEDSSYHTGSCDPCGSTEPLKRLFDELGELDEQDQPEVFGGSNT